MRATRYWAFAGFWAIVIFTLSSIPGKSLPPLPNVWQPDKLAHCAVYGVLGALCFLAVRRTWPLSRWQLVAAATALALLYGLTDEFHQLFVPGRSADWFDALADGIGGLLGSAVASVLPFAKPEAAR